MNPNHPDIPTPCYVLDERALRRNLEILDRVQRATGAQILCALKGFALFSAFPIVRQYLPGVTASSLNEARLGFEEFGGEVHACAPAYLDDEFDDLLFFCSHITFNSLAQWDRFKSRVQASDTPVSAALRINPEHSEVRTALYDPCAPGSRLGVIADQLGGQLPDGIDGLHFHTLCECRADALERTLEAVEKRFGSLLHASSWLNMGGGHHITRADYDGDQLIRLINAMRDAYKVDVYLEPGEAVGWQTGVLVARVLDIVENHGVQTAILDTSFTAHMPDCLEMPYKPAIRGATDPRSGKPTYRMGGLSCLAGDAVGDYSFERPLGVGDRVIFEDMIHYTMVKTTTFNGVNLPSIGIWTENDRFDLIRSFGYEDYRNRLS